MKNVVSLLNVEEETITLAEIQLGTKLQSTAVHVQYI